MAGDEGFEPPILGPEPSALPLGQSPIVFEYTAATSGWPLIEQHELYQIKGLLPRGQGAHPSNKLRPDAA
jgi:hypothetical protein